MRQQHQHCHHIALAENGIGNANICPACGIVNLHLRALSLRLEPEAFHALAEMIAQAQNNLTLLSQAHPGHPGFAAMDHEHPPLDPANKIH